MLKIFKSLARSLKAAVANDPEIRNLEERHPKVVHFVRRRLTPDEKFGLYLTIGVVIGVTCLYYFFQIVEDLIHQDVRVQADIRILNLLQILRTPSFNRVALLITDLAAWQVIAIGAIAIVLLLALAKRWHYVVALVVSLSGGEAFVWIVKRLVQRPRPPLANALVPTTDLSFPSGHAFVAISFYGFLAYLLFRSTRGKLLKLLYILAGVIVIFAIGFSRMYLGAHWPSDVLGSLTAGAAWLTVFITALEIRRKFGEEESQKPYVAKWLIGALGGFFALLWASYLFYFYQAHPLQIAATAEETPVLMSEKDISSKFFTLFPRRSEDIVGIPMEPINLLVVGTREKLDESFAKAGWFPVDEISPKTLWRVTIAAIKNNPYPEAPGIPTFWDKNANDFAYEQPTPIDSVRQRHHVHFWTTPIITDQERKVWVATAHFDQGIEIKLALTLPSHRVDPAVDKEREKIKNDLFASGNVESMQSVQVVDPILGKNRSGDFFFTDGKAYVIFLKK